MLILSSFFKLKKPSQFSLLLVGDEKQFCCPGLRLPKFLGSLSFLSLMFSNQPVTFWSLSFSILSHIICNNQLMWPTFCLKISLPLFTRSWGLLSFLFFFCLPIHDMWPCCQVFCQHITWVTTVWLLLLSLYYVLIELKATAPCLRQYPTSSTSFHMRQVIILPSITPTSQWIK